jgi:cysteine desulfurase/selenocysteine lyase
VDVQAIGCDFLAFSGHKICGPTGIGVLWGRQELLDAMPPYQGGGEMILSVEYQKTEFKKAPHRFEAGTPDISGPIGLHAAMDYLDAIGRENIWKHDQELAAYAYEKLAALKNIRLFGPKTGRAGLVSFLLKDVHAHDVVTLADQAGVALRGGHHCTQPLMHKLGVESTARASFYFYNTQAEVDRFVEVVKEIQKFFGHQPDHPKCQRAGRHDHQRLSGAGNDQRRQRSAVRVFAKGHDIVRIYPDQWRHAEFWPGRRLVLRLHQLSGHQLRHHQQRSL